MGTGIFIETPSLDDCQPKSTSSARERKRLHPASSQSGISCKVVDETWPLGLNHGTLKNAKGTWWWSEAVQRAVQGKKRA